MRLRQRLANALKQRLVTYLSKEMKTVCDDGDVQVNTHSGAAKVLCVIEQLSFTPASGYKGNWQQTVEFSGTVRAEIHTDDIDQLGVEPLISNLLTDPLTLLPDSDTAKEALSEQVCCVLTEWRDNVNEMRVTSALYFELHGSLLRKIPAPDTPELHFSQAPQTGVAYRHNYRPITELSIHYEQGAQHATKKQNNRNNRRPKKRA